MLAAVSTLGFCVRVGVQISVSRSLFRSDPAARLGVQVRC